MHVQAQMDTKHMMILIRQPKLGTSTTLVLVLVGKSKFLRMNQDAPGHHRQALASLAENDRQAYQQLGTRYLAPSLSAVGVIPRTGPAS